ncbi:transcriptional regulator [Pandoraea capi]|uniref:Transcriptional regulator n=1 Tax=Pandoraea capi TaxID=2508286 RepID=A0ABY6VLD7_9BURK|nr:transcriptional regulator GcvA [Pandoraea capi]VVD61262.1 transcriptional regulator [Pandoraea capi]
MVARKLPSLNALRAFEAAARHCSFTLAAQELHVTQGAVSHQIKALEEALGRPLFDRLANQLRLTRQGQTYLEAIGEAFDRIERATAAFDTHAARQRLAISCSPNFSAKWLVPRLGDFTLRHPQLELQLEQSERHVNFVGDNIDAAIRYGAGPWPGLTCMHLTDEFLLPVCAPALAGDGSEPTLDGMPLLHVHDRSAWAQWFAARGLTPPEWRDAPGIVFNHESAAIDAAVAGQGMALARWSLVALALDRGLLSAPFPAGAPLEKSYWLVYPEERRDDDNILAFSDWLRASFDADQEVRAKITSA